MTHPLRAWNSVPSPLRVAIWYLIFSLSWIAGTDLLASRLVDESELLTFVQTAKGWLFAGASALLIGVVGMLEQRRHASTQTRYERIFNDSPLAISLVALEDACFEEVNPEFTRMFGYRRQELLGHSVPDLGIWRDEADRDRVIGALRRDGSLRNVETQFRRADRTTFPALWSGFIVDVDHVPHILALTADLSQQKHTQERIVNLHSELEARVERLRAMQEISDAILQTFDLDHSLGVVLRHTIEQLAVDAAHVMLFDPVEQVLTSRAAKGFQSDRILASRLALGEGRAGEAARTRSPVLVPDLSAVRARFVRGELVAEESFVSYYCVPLVAKGELQGVLEMFDREPMAVNPSWEGVAADIGRQAAIAINDAQLFNDLQHAHEELRLSYDRTIEGWARALDMRNEETAGHSQRVTELAVDLAKRLGVRGDPLADIRRGALLHDIGKMAVPDRILLKPDSLDPAEWEIMKQHTVHGHEMLAGIPFLTGARTIPYAHHERWDGAGYPRGLAGEEIPLSARIFAIVDVFDALTHERPYRPAWSREEAVAYLQRQRGTQFDPNVATTFLALLRDRAASEA